MTNTLITAEIPTVGEMISGNLFASDFYRINHWAYHFGHDKAKNDAYNDCMCVVMVKKGRLNFDLSKNQFEMHSGHVLFDKPDYQFRFRPAIGACSVFNFTDDFYRRFLEDMHLKRAYFFSNPQLFSLQLLSTPEIEYLHDQILRKVGYAGKLEMDNLVLEFLHQIVHRITSGLPEVELDVALRKHHLQTIEQAKCYLHEHFSADVSLQEIARHCLVSPFHFSRIFKKFTTFSPHQYLQNIRLKHGEMLLKNSLMPVSDIAYAAGFSSVEYFATAFRQKYLASPSRFRSGNLGLYDRIMPV